MGAFGSGEGVGSGELAEGSLVETLFGEDAEEDGAQVGGSLLVFADGLDAGQAHALRVGGDGAAGLEVADLFEGFDPVPGFRVARVAPNTSPREQRLDPGGVSPLLIGDDREDSRRAGIAAVARGETIDTTGGRRLAAMLLQQPLVRSRGSDLVFLHQRLRVRLGDLATERLVLAPVGQKHRDIVGRAVAAVSDAPAEAPISADGWALMLAFVAMRRGVAVVNGICRPPRGVVLRPIPELGRTTYHLVWRRDAPPSPARESLAERILSPCPP